MCHSDRYVARREATIERYIKIIVEEQSAEEWTVALELCPESFLEQKALRLHVHLVLI